MHDIPSLYYFMDPLKKYLPVIHEPVPDVQCLSFSFSLFLPFRKGKLHIFTLFIDAQHCAPWYITIVDHSGVEILVMQVLQQLTFNRVAI